MDREEKRDLFWNTHLNGYQKDILKEAHFATPEQLLNMPIIYLEILEGFGFPCLIAVLSTLYEYLEIKEDTEVRKEIKELFDYVSENEREEDKPNFNSEIETELLVDDIFFVLGYDTATKISQITVRELFNMKGLSFEIMESVATEVVKTYYKTYAPPKMKFKTKYDFKEHGIKLF